MAIDLRSDTVTQPSPGMRDAIAHAPVGDDVYGDDPTVNSLEKRIAEMFGKEAGLFSPTGSLANQLAIRLLVAPGEEKVVDTLPLNCILHDYKCPTPCHGNREQCPRSQPNFELMLRVAHLSSRRDFNKATSLVCLSSMPGVSNTNGTPAVAG